MADRRKDRLSALGARLVAEKIDAIVLTGLANIRYLTGFSGTSAIAVATQSDIRLITDFRYETQVAEEVGDLADVRIEQISLWTGLWDLLHKVPSIEMIGFESPHLLHRDFQR